MENIYRKICIFREGLLDINVVNDHISILGSWKQTAHRFTGSTYILHDRQRMRIQCRFFPLSSFVWWNWMPLTARLSVASVTHRLCVATPARRRAACLGEGQEVSEHYTTLSGVCLPLIFPLWLFCYCICLAHINLGKKKSTLGIVINMSY